MIKELATKEKMATVIIFPHIKEMNLKYLIGSSDRRAPEQLGAHDGDDEPGDDEKVPLLFVDVNLGQGKTERIVVYEGDKSEALAQRFSEEHGKVAICYGYLNYFD